MNPLRSLNIYLANKSCGHRKIETILRFIKVKAWKFLKVERSFVLQSDTRIKMLYRPGCSVSEKCYVIGFYDYDGMNFIRKFCGKGDVFYDIGANVGPFSLLAHYGGAEVFAFDGAPSTIKRLRNNFVINGIRASNAIHAAVTDCTGIVDFNDTEGSSTNKVGKFLNSVKVPAIKIDDFVRNSRPPTFIKIDTEGHEYQVILGLQETLKSGRVKYLSFEANGLLNSQDLDNVYRILIASGYKVGLIDIGNRVFQTQKSLGLRSPTGDYQALSQNMCTYIQRKGFQCL